MDLSRLDVKDLTEPEIYFELVKEMKRAILETTNGYMKVGEILEQMFETNLYKFSGFDTWEDFVTDVCRMSVSGADHTRRVYRKFNGLLGDKDIPFTRLLEIVPIANDSNTEDLLFKAQNDDGRTWKNTIGIEKGRPDQDECPHSRQITKTLCKDCGRWLKDGAKPVETPAEWSHEPCPKCGAPFVARDKFGLFCCMSGCDWKEKS